MYTNEELTGFIIGSIITLILAAMIIYLSNTMVKRKIKNMQSGQYYRYYDDLNDPYVVKLLVVSEAQLTYLTKDQEKVVTTPVSFAQCFEKLTEHEVKKYDRFLPDK